MDRLFINEPIIHGSTEMLPRLHISVTIKYCPIIVPSPLIITLAVAITIFTITNSITDDG